MRLRFWRRRPAGETRAQQEARELDVWARSRRGDETDGPATVHVPWYRPGLRRQLLSSEKFEPVVVRSGRRSRVEYRAITSVPWNAGGPLGSPTGSIERATSLAPVFACVRFLADCVSTLPLDRYRLNADGRSTKLPKHGLLLNPGIRGTVVEWLHRAVVSMALRGNAFGLILEEDSYGIPTTIEWLHPDWVTVEDAAQSGPGSYWQPIWRVHGQVVNAADIIHIPWFPVPGKVLGLTPIQAYAQTINVGITAMDYSETWFANGGVPPGKFKNSAKRVDPDEAEVITDRLVTRIKTGRPLVYGADWEFEPIAIQPAEARFIETMRLTATTIAAIYGVDPTYVGGDAGSQSVTYANVESRFIQILTTCLRPWLERIEAVLSSLYPKPQEVRFDVDSFLRTDAKTRAEINSLALGGRGAAWRTVDEVRRTDNLPPLGPEDVVGSPSTAAPGAGEQAPPAAGVGGAQPPTSKQSPNGRVPVGTGGRALMPPYLGEN